MKQLLPLTLLLSLVLSSNITAAEYLMLSDSGSSAKSIALGNIIGFDHSANAALENPAALHKSKNTSVSLYTTTFVNDFTINSLAISQETPWGTFALAYMGGNVSDIPSTNINESNGRFIQSGTIDFTESITKLAYQHDLKANWHFGASVNQYKKEIGPITGSALDLEIGLQKTFKQWPTLLSFNAKNVMGNSVSYTKGATEKLPLVVSVGITHKLSYLDFYAQVQSHGEKGLLNAAGVSAYVPGFTILKGLAGFKEFYVLDKKKSSATLGLELAFGKLRFNYAYEKSTYPGVNNKSYFSLAINANPISILSNSKHRLKRINR